MQKVVEFIWRQSMFFEGIVERILVHHQPRLPNSRMLYQVDTSCTYRVVEDLNVACVLVDDTALVDKVLEHVIVHSEGIYTIYSLARPAGRNLAPLSGRLGPSPARGATATVRDGFRKSQ